jgi:hypothetical protein
MKLEIKYSWHIRRYDKDIRIGRRAFAREETDTWCRWLLADGFTFNPLPESSNPATITVQHRNRSAMSLFVLKHNCNTLRITSTGTL